MNTIKHASFLVWIFIIILSCSSNNDNSNIHNEHEIEIDFVKTLGGTKNESAQAICKTPDGGYAILGYTQSIDGDIETKTNESFDYWLLKFDSNNQLQWQKTYGGTNDDRGSDIIQTSDGGFAIIGFTKSNNNDVTENAGSSDFWLAKLDNAGNISWQKNYGFSGADNGISVIQTNDNGFLLTGVLDVSASGGLGNSKNASIKHAGGDYWVIKIDVLGNKEWSHYYGGTFTDTPYDAFQTEDNSYLIVGSSDSDDVDINKNKGSYDFWIIKISETGGLIWEKSFGGSEIDEARAITSSGDGNYVIVGDTRSSDLNVSKNKGAADLWVIKISPEGNLIWEKTFGGSSFDVGRSVFKTKDNSFLISGSSRSADGDISTNQGQNDAWILKIDVNANLIWQKNIGGSEIDFTYDAVELEDETIIAVGESGSSNNGILENKGFTDLLLIKLK
ncbi:hypothetical protein SAMN05428642_101525 [Flaviramulus basaltis]|uniref:Bulb-type lectin domain-containing protein n=1 Tax=Flaviramulus basaltis TaxID=369401 RepID=A0A1K2IBC7_9FLAO|nr:hypothetical protein [Flaviramulus basaltis]SFZ89724.1 hypothetical protein SAMN05428642_101525 [Flaviramulus basaltis]